MDQEKIGKLIKKIRIEGKYSQKEFAEKYGVTPQAVSKWENGKNIPDIAILKEICNDNNLKIDEFLNAKSLEKKKNIIIIIIIILSQPFKNRLEVAMLMLVFIIWLDYLRLKI